jgi:hypothetical protein
VLLQMRLWACLSHVSTYRCAVRFSFSAAAAPAHTLRALLLASSPLLVLKHLPVTHPWRSDGLVGPSSHSWSLCVDTLALFAGDRRTRALQGIASSTTKLVRRPVLPPTLHSCGSLSKSFGPSPSPSPLERLVLFAERCSSWVCVPSRCRVVWRFSFSQHSMLVVTLVLAVVFFVLWTYPMSALHREMWGEQNVLCLPVIVEPSPML